MIVVKPFEGEKINVSHGELAEINAIFDASAASWKKPDYIVDLFKAGNSGNGKWVYLRSEGWHQLEKVGGDSYLHISLHLNGWTYHCYTKVAGFGDKPSKAAHRIDCISYQTYGGQSSYLYPG